MTKIMDAMIAEIGNCVPEAEHYKGRIAEGFARPAFLYLPSYHGETKHNCFLKDVTIEIQVICFGKKDGYGVLDYDEALEIRKKLEVFLGLFRLNVEDRVLHFTYEWKEADENPAFYISLHYLEDAPDPERDQMEAQEAAGSVEFRERVK